MNSKNARPKSIPGRRQVIFNKAIDKDKTFAAAYAGLADTYQFMMLTNRFGSPDQTLIPKAKKAAETALCNWMTGWRRRTRRLRPFVFGFSKAAILNRNSKEPLLSIPATRREFIGTGCTSRPAGGKRRVHSRAQAGA